MDWKRIEELFAAALEQPEEERDALLESATRHQPELRREVERLLDSERRSGDFLEQPALAGSVREEEAAALGLEVPHYQMQRKLGEGGMGSVFLAQRDDDVYQRQVAIKFLAGGLWSDQLVERFRAERQILADLEHPYIARLLDGGTTRTGVPYFVMEYVEGAPIDEYCDRERLSTSARIELFDKVCAAVHYAHTNLVVHRDIKPSNIVVRDDGEPRLLDFGIAKLLDDRTLASGAEPTVGLPMMTPAFASPEQLSRRTITTASDIYSLGVLLYLLLSGRHPYVAEHSSLPQIIGAVCSEEPPPPSVAVARRGAGGESPEALAALRRTSAAQLRRQLAGDLDTIVLKALDKEPARRYLSVEQFAGDLRRHRDGFPVLARRDTVSYRLRKFVGRNPLRVAAGIAFLALVLAFSVVTTAQSARLRRALARAEHEATKAKAVSQFLEQTLGSAHPFRGMGRDVTLLEVLERTAAEIDAGSLTQDPEVEATARRTVGITYLNLGQYDAAAPLLGRALEIRQRVLDEDHPDVAESLLDLAALLTARGQLDMAALHAEQAIEMLLRSPQGAEMLGKALYSLGRIRRQQERFDDAQALLEEALARRRAALPPDDPILVVSLRQLASVLYERGEYERSEALYQEALAMLHRSPAGASRPQLSLVLSDLALLRRSQGRIEEAQELLEQALALRRELLGADHTAVAEALNNLAAVLADRGDYDAAEGAIRQALEIYQQVLGEEDRSVAGSLANLGAIRLRRGDLQTAERLFRRALDLDRRLLGEHHSWVATDLENLGNVLRIKGDLAGAEAHLRQALSIKQQQLGPGHPAAAQTLHALAGVLQDRGDAQGALGAYREALELYGQTLDDDHWSVAVCRSDLGALLAELGRHEEAERLLHAAKDSLEASLGPAHEQTQLAAGRLERLLAARSVGQGSERRSGS